MSRKWIVLAVLVCVGISQATQAASLSEKDVKMSKNATLGRDGKALANEFCQTTAMTNGVCMTRFACQMNKGTALGFCGTYGVCCDLNLKCDGTTKLKRVTVRSPTPVPTDCQYTIEPYSSNVCQIKIEFSTRMAQPLVAPDAQNQYDIAQCVNEYFDFGYMRVCGVNTNQHIYIPVDNVPVTIRYKTLGSTQATPATWDMTITQLECPSATARSHHSSHFRQQSSVQDLKRLFVSSNGDLDQLAPPGCLQYFNKPSGTVESFNFNNGLGMYTANQKYAICFRRTKSDQQILFNSGSVFQLSINDAPIYGGVDSDCKSPIDTPGRLQDYLTIAESMITVQGVQIFGTHYCGTSLQNTQIIFSPPGPFVIYFVTDNIYAPLTERGFQLNYSVM